MNTIDASEPCPSHPPSAAPVCAPSNWAQDALLEMDEAFALVRWGSVSMADSEKYNKAAAAFWRVAEALAAESKRIKAALQS